MTRRGDIYHPAIVQQACERFEAKYRTPLIRYEMPQIEEWLARLPKLNDKGDPVRGLTKEENAFITNERVLTQYDFLYWATRYGKFIADPETGEPGLQRFSPWETQRISLDLTAKVQLEQWEKKKRGETVDGIKRVDHKARQQGLTQLSCFMTVHRMTRRMYQRCLSASVDGDKVQELYDRHKQIYDELPWYLKPDKGKPKFDVKAKDLQFEETGAVMLYQEATQKGGVGQGRARDVLQLTEMASWDSVAGWDTTRVQFELQLLPTIPRSIWTLGMIESTSLVRGDWWHDFCDRVRRKRVPGWVYNFIPYYAEEKRYTMTAPADYTPSEMAMRHAQRVWETSTEFVGRKIMLSKNQLCWYDTHYEAAREAKALNLFLTNYPATPEDSFQHATRSAFDTELLDDLRKRVKEPGFYEQEFVGA